MQAWPLQGWKGEPRGAYCWPGRAMSPMQVAKGRLMCVKHTTVARYSKFQEKGACTMVCRPCWQQLMTMTGTTSGLSWSLAMLLVLPYIIFRIS